MNAAYDSINESRAPECDAARDLDAWFTVSGDTDDFIFYGEPDKPHSEK